jgi:hypothetical protein
MQAASPPATNDVALPRIAALAQLRPLAAGLAVTALITGLRLTGTVDSDVAWQLWIAGRIHAGANLYRDIIETNPPLWFWMALPVDRLATLLHLRIEAVLIASLGSVSAMAIAATNRLIRHIPPGRRTLLLGYAALCLMVMPWVHVGQREQIVLIGTLPYTALIASRRSGSAVPPLLAAGIGLGAALGFALKHYFLFVPALLELWLLICNPRSWRLVRPETSAVVALGTVYIAAALLFEPNFFTDIIPLLRLAYGQTGAPSLRYLFGPFALVGMVTLAFVAVQRRVLWSKETPFTSALEVAAFGFAAAYFIQLKGWAYHAIPLVGCSSLAVAAVLAESLSPLRWLRLIAPALLTLPLALSADEATHPDLPSPDLRGAVVGLRPGDAVGFVTTETAIPWSVTLQGGYRYASRYNGFWMMPAIARNEGSGAPDPGLGRLGRQIVAETVADFTCLPPKRIIVWRSRDRGNGSDLLPFFLREPDFAALLAHYKVRSRTSLETYELVSPLPRPTGPCRARI